MALLKTVHEGIFLGLLEFDPSLKNKLPKQVEAGTIYGLKIDGEKIFYVEEDNSDITFSSYLTKKNKNSVKSILYSTFRLELRYVFQEFNEVGRSVSEKYIDFMKAYNESIDNIFKYGKEQVREKMNNTNKKVMDYSIYIYANFDSKVAILRIHEKNNINSKEENKYVFTFNLGSNHLPE